MAQPMNQNYMAYDRTIVVFSPDGRLLQVEYARQMVKNGTTALAVKVKDAVILASVKTQTSLIVNESYRKISEIDNHIATVSAGSLADARDLVSIARIRAQINKITFNEPISVASLATEIADRKHVVTQYAGVRPYGVGLLIGGIDESGPKLFETEPSGTMIEWKAQTIGRGAEKAKKVLSKQYREGMSVEEGTKLVFKALKAGEKDLGAENVELVVISRKGIERFESSKFTKAFKVA